MGGALDQPVTAPPRPRPTSGTIPRPPSGCWARPGRSRPAAAVGPAGHRRARRPPGRPGRRELRRSGLPEAAAGQPAL